MFDKSPSPVQTREAFVSAGGILSTRSVRFVTDLWSWVTSGYVVIPCSVGGTANAIEVTPIFEPRKGASGYVHLLPISFVAASTSTGAVTIQLGDLDAVPAYIGAAQASTGDVVADVPYLGFYCDATDSLAARIVLK